MFKYYKNIFTCVSMFAWPEAWWTDLSVEKKALIETVNSIELTQKQLNEIKSEINTRWENVEGYNIKIWRKWEIAKINWATSKDDLSRLQNKYTQLQNQIKQESIDDRGNLSDNIATTTDLLSSQQKMINNLIANSEQKTSSNLSSPAMEDSSTTNQPETALNNTTSIKNISVTLDKDYSGWVKENLKKDEYFANINNPTQDEIVKVLNEFKNKKFDWKKWPEWWTSAIFAIQWALQLLWNNITVDWMYWNETKKIIIEFQTNNNLKPDWIPGPKTLSALLSSLEK